MSTHKYLEALCCILLVIALLITIIFMNGEAIGIESKSSMGYEDRIFDYTEVHSIDIVMEDWDSFIETCENEEYAPASVTIDGETYQNVGIRAKGNTSLSSVSSMNSDRYSFKIEFDQYENGKSYYGLDKLVLNNVIQDNSYMKDFLVYQMMEQFGVAAPLCSYVYITVNGEAWGLYLAVEAVEDSFLQRNYGNDYGDLYKPDSMSMGGGRGQGKDFNMEDFDFSQFETPSNDSNESDGESTAMPQMGNSGNMDFGNMPNFGNMGSFPNMGQSSGGEDSESSAFDPSTFDPSSMEMPDMGNMDFGNMPNFGNMGGFPNMGQSSGGEGSESSTFDPSTFDPSSMEMPDMGNMDFGNMPDMGGFGGFGMGSSDVKLQYSDDDPDSYSNIFGSAKTTVTEADQQRLIASLKDLSNYENLSEVLDMEAVLRYFVVHNFVVNGDSYTGSMIHNYYLYEEDGQLSMIPWDYNLAYGTFQGGNASSAVNDPIDSPLSVSSDRPMAYWMFTNETYTNAYHSIFQQFMDEFFADGQLLSLLDSTAELIAPYVQADPSKFCSYEEFETGVETLRSFLSLRSESVSGQLNGSIPSTDEGQSADSSTLIKTGDLNLSAMGSMGGGFGGGGFNFGGREDRDPGSDRSPANENTQRPASGEGTVENSSQRPQMSFGSQGGKGEMAFELPTENGERPSRGDFGGMGGTTTTSSSPLPLVISAVVLLLGLLVVKCYRRR